MSAEQVVGTLEQYEGRFQTCYQRFIKVHAVGIDDLSTLEGTVTVEFHTNSAGRATDVSIVENPLETSGMDKCIRGIVQSLTFPASDGDTTSEVTIHFRLKR